MGVDRLKSEDDDATHGSVVSLRCICRVVRSLLGKLEFPLVSDLPSRTKEQPECAPLTRVVKDRGVT